jgi:hypothetical protein
VESYFLKGDRCFKPSCAIENAGTKPPGSMVRPPQDDPGYGSSFAKSKR